MKLAKKTSKFELKDTLLFQEVTDKLCNCAQDVIQRKSSSISKLAAQSRRRDGEILPWAAVCLSPVACRLNLC